MHSYSPYQEVLAPVENPAEDPGVYLERFSYYLSEPTDMSGYSPHQSGAPSAGPLAGQSEYPSLFQSSAEIPSFYVSYLWWEDEAATILWAFDVEKVKRVIRYSLFPDENFPRKALQNRHGNTVDDFLSGLVQPHERNFIPNLSQVQKVEEIMRRCRISSPPPAAWSWFPGQRANEPNPEAIARAIDTESFLHYTRISFEELVRYSLGYKVASVEWFLQQHTALYVHLLDYLSAFPDEIARYIEVETVCNGDWITLLREPQLTWLLFSTFEVGVPSPTVLWFTVSALWTRGNVHRWRPAQAWASNSSQHPSNAYSATCHPA